jgi:hypothetical protein
LFDESESVIRGELRRDEQLLWSGRPPQGLRLTAADAALIPFSLLWGGFAIFWETSVIAAGAPFFFMLWGVPFVLIGLHLIFGRFLADAWQRSRTCYGMTNDRILIVSGIFTRNTRSLNLRTLSDVTLNKKANGSGTIAFGPMNWMNSWWGNAGWPGTSRYAPPSIEVETNADEVYEKILAVQKNRDRINGA